MGEEISPFSSVGAVFILTDTSLFISSATIGTAASLLVSFSGSRLGIEGPDGSTDLTSFVSDTAVGVLVPTSAALPTALASANGFLYSATLAMA